MFLRLGESVPTESALIVAAHLSEAKSGRKFQIMMHGIRQCKCDLVWQTIYEI